MKRRLINQIQKIPGVTTVEKIHIAPEDPDEVLVLIYFDPELFKDDELFYDEIFG